MTIRNLVFRNSYRDSVVLMRLSQDLTREDGVERATAIMGTANNKELLEGAGLLVQSGSKAGANDLIIAVQLASQDAESVVTGRVQEIMDSEKRVAGSGPHYRPRSLDGALSTLPEANLAVISVPGEYAAYEAGKALDLGLHVLLFSDNVSLEDEVALKQQALGLGLFMLGPDCGTALINGVPVGFANVVPRGRVGLVSASGTGLQQVMCLIAAGGEGVSQALGVGSRDLDDRVGGAMMLEGLRALDRDPATEVIVLISKPPGPAANERVLAALRQCSKPCVVCFLGMDAGNPDTASVFVEDTLQGAASRVLRLLGGDTSTPEPTVPTALLTRLDEINGALAPGRRYIRGLYSGGTLCYESLLFLRGRGIEVASNLELEGIETLDDEQSSGHVLIDLGDDRFTVGVPHPMIDPRLRCERIVREAADPKVGIMLVDVMLGYGAHPDPASDLSSAFREAHSVASEAGHDIACVAVLCGTPGDPQSLAEQRAKLEAAGVLVVPSNIQAIGIAAALTLGDLSIVQRGPYQW